MSTIHFLCRASVLVTLIAPFAAWSADAPVKAGKPAVQAASGAKPGAAKKASTSSNECPLGTGATTGSTGLTSKSETGTQGGSIQGPKKPKCPELAGKVATPK